MKDLKPNGGKKPPKKEVKATDPKEKGNVLVEDQAPSLTLDIAEMSKEDLEVELNPDVFEISENLPQNTEYLKEDSEAQNEALEEAAKNDEEVIVHNDYGSSEWRLITSSINDKIGYRCYTHAMPLGDKGRGGCMIKTMAIQQGNVSVHTIIDRSVRLTPDPKSVNTYILK